MCIERRQASDRQSERMPCFGYSPCNWRGSSFFTVGILSQRLLSRPARVFDRLHKARSNRLHEGRFELFFWFARVDLSLFLVVAVSVPSPALIHVNCRARLMIA
jgi:hypothetical protein